MSDTKISEAAIEAGALALSKYCRGSEVAWEEDRASFRVALAAAIPHIHPQPAELADAGVIEHIAQQWDGCKYESPGETLDIGAAIRRAGKRLSAELAEQQGVSAPDCCEECSRRTFHNHPDGYICLHYKLVVETRQPNAQFALDALVAAGHVERSKVDQALAIGENLAATGKQQVGEVEALPPEMRSSDTGYLDYLDDSKQVGEVQGDALRGRTPADYAIEHAGYLVTAANQVLEARNELDALVLRREEDDDVDEDEMQAAQECVGDANSVLRIAIHEFEKRRDRALAARQPVAQVPVVVEAVATIKLDRDGEFYVDWLTEGGIHDLSVGDVLLAANSAITNDEGYGEVYAAPHAQSIDLGPLAEALRKADSLIQKSNKLSVDAVMGLILAPHVRALIDQRDAAPGVGNG